MAIINKTGIGNGNVIQAEHITRIIDSLNGSGSYSIAATGSFSGSFRGVGWELTGISAGNIGGPLGMNSILSASFATTASHVNLVAGPNITINKVNNSFQISGSGGGGGGNPAGANTEIQFNNNGNFGASPFFTFNPSIHSFEQGNSVLANGTGSHAEGHFTTASGQYSHAEGYQTFATGNYSHAEGFRSIAQGFASHAKGGGSDGYATRVGGMAIGTGSHAEGFGSQAIGNGSHAEGDTTIAIGLASHAEGLQTTASGDYSHAEGNQTTAVGSYSHAEGEVTIANGYASHAEGVITRANGPYSHAEGYGTIATGTGSHAEGQFTTATADYSHAAGYFTTAHSTYQLVIGEVNNTTGGGPFVIGKGFFSIDPFTFEITFYPSNAFRVNGVGSVFAASNYNTPGADYAEYFESHDGQSIPVGTVVELTGSYIKPCENPDNAIGVISATPTVVGNTEDGTADEWVGKYEKDEWGRHIMEDYILQHPDHIISGSTETTGSYEAITRKKPKLNPNFDPNKQYIPRSERPEWNIVGLMGQIKVLKDQPINSRWIKMKDINDNIALYLVR